MTPAFVAAEGGRGGRAIRGEGEAQLAYSPAGQSRSGGGNDVMSLHMPVAPCFCHTLIHTLKTQGIILFYTPPHYPPHLLRIGLSTDPSQLTMLITYLDLASLLYK